MDRLVKKDKSQVKLLSFIAFNLFLHPLPSVCPVPPQRLSNRPLHADGDHHGAKTDME